MKVKSTFSPITITIETVYELQDLILGLERAKEYSRRGWSILRGSYQEDSTDQLVNHLIRELKTKD